MSAWGTNLPAGEESGKLGKAPELNFLSLMTVFQQNPKYEMVTVFKNIRRVGEEPDPQHFQIPEDFELVEK